MPRTARAVGAGLVYHVMNRGNGRARLFHTPADYDAFQRVLAEALERFPGVALIAYCLMPNHWHLVLRPRSARALSRFISWLCVTHVRRHHAHHRTRGGGHLYQGRYKSLPAQDDHHLLVLLRYVESNARRATLVRRAEGWRWCSLRSYGRRDARNVRNVRNDRNDRIDRERGRGAAGRKGDAIVIPLQESPVPRPKDWLALVNEPIAPRELQRMRECVRRGRPWGDPQWTERTARRLGLTFTLRDPGRPKKEPKAAK